MLKVMPFLWRHYVKSSAVSLASLYVKSNAVSLASLDVKSNAVSVASIDFKIMQFLWRQSILN